MQLLIIAVPLRNIKSLPMNNKSTILNTIIDIVLDCCSMQVGDERNVTRQDLLGDCRRQNVVMTRCILVHMILAAGYSVDTIALLLNKTARSVRHMSDVGYQFLQTSRAYRIAYAEATLRCKSIQE